MAKEIIEKKTAGRPFKPIDWVEADKHIMAGAKQKEIAAFFDMTDETFCNRCLKEKGINYTEYSQALRSKGDFLIRAKVFQKAINQGHWSALLHLCKHRLGEWDKLDEKSVTPETMASFQALMAQITASQSATFSDSDSKIDSSSISDEQ